MIHDLLIALGIIFALVCTLFAFAACRLSGIADDTAEQIARQLGQGVGAVPPVVQIPLHDGSHNA